MTEIIQNGEETLLCIDGKPYAKILSAQGAEDSFEPLETGAWRWRRHTAAPVDRMRMEIVVYGKPDFTMIPAVSYNGNGWGTTPEYVGDRCDGTP